MKKDWTYKKLGEVCEKITDGSHNPPKGVMHSNFRMLSSQNIFNHYIDYNAGVRYVSEVDYNVENRRTSLQADDVLMTIVGTIGRSCVVSDNDKNIVLQRSVAVLRPKKDIVLSHYLSYSIHGLNEKINKEAHGIAQKGIYLRQLSDISIPIPPLSIQRSIVSELDLLHSVIEKKQEQLRALDNLAQSLFYQMFGDPITNPMGWEVKKLGKVCVSELGKTLNQSKDTGVLRPYLCAINISWGRIDTTNLKQTRFEDYELDRYSVQKGDLLICEGGDTGRAAIWEKDMPMLYQNALHRVRFNDNVLAVYALYWLHYLKMKGEIDNKYSKGVTIKHLVKSSLLSIPIPLPPLSLQQSFAAKVSAIEAQKRFISQSIKDVESLLAQRMDHYFG